MSRRRRIKPGQYGTNLRVVSALFSANRIDEVTVASDGSKSLTKLINEDQAGEADIQDNVSATYTANGTYEVQPWPNKDGMEKATITVNVPIEEQKDVTIDVSTYTDPVEIVPSSTNVAIEGATVTLTNIPQAVTTQIKDATIDVSTYDGSNKPVITPDTGYDAITQSTITLTGMPAIKPMELATIDVSSYSDTVTVAPTGGYDVMEEAAITLTGIPAIEADKTATIDVSSYTDPVEIEPTTGNDAMSKATVTLTNIPNGNVYLYEWDFGSKALYTAGIPDDTYDGQPVQTIVGDDAGLIIETAASTVYHYDAADANKYITYNGQQYNYVGQTCALSQTYGV